MDDETFAAIRTQIDEEIDARGNAPFAIKMGFGLAGEFLVRGLLANIIVDMVLWKWAGRAYRDHLVYPEPMMNDYDYVIGDPKA